MKEIGKKLLVFLCAAAMCVTFVPITASASGGSVTLGTDVANATLGMRKVLNLEGTGASVTFTDADKEANIEEATQEFDTIIAETVDLFEPVYNGMAKYIQDNYGTTYNLALVDDSGNPYDNWPELLAEQADANENIDMQAIVSEASDAVENAEADTDYISYEDASNFVETAYNYLDKQDATLIPGSRMEKYLRYRYLGIIYAYHEYLDKDYGSSSSSFANDFADWYEEYVDVKNLEGNTSNAGRTHFIDKRSVQLNSETINERLQEVLSNARFDFYLEPFDSDEEDANGIGSEITIGDYYTLPVYNGGFEDSSADSVHLTYVDFSNEDQFYDSDLWDAMPDFGDILSGNIFEEGYIGIDGLSLGDYFFLFDGGSLESYTEPYVHKAGGLTYTPWSIWPYESATRGAQDTNWNAESLADYDIFGDGVGESEPDGDYWSFTEEIPLTGGNSFSSTGYDIYIPYFDSDGNLLSVSKPLLNELRDPEDAVKDPDQFDRENLLNSLDFSNGSGVYRYKIVEKNDYDARVNGQKVVASDDYQILDVVYIASDSEDEDDSITAAILAYDDIDDVSDAYSDESLLYTQMGTIGYGLAINNYAAQGSVTLKAKKTIDGSIPESDQTFEFQVIDEDGNVVSTGVNKRGSVTFDPISLTGDDMGQTLTYTIVEVSDSGSGGTYTYDDSYYTAEVTVGDSVDEEGNIQGTTVVYKDSDGNELDGLPVFRNETTTETTTSPTGSITIHKTLDTYDADKSIFDQEDLTLYGFTLYAKNDIVSPSDGTTVLYEVGTAVSDEVSCDENGNAEISGILPGEYVLKETKMPEGTSAVTSEPEITVTADDSDSVSVYVNGEKQSSTDVIDFENYVSKTEIEKQNESGEYLEGATLQIIDYETGKVVDTWVSGTDAHKVAGLELGHTYTLREVDAPDGYEIADDIAFVPEGSDVQTVTMIDSKTSITTEDTTEETDTPDTPDTTDTTETDTPDTSDTTDSSNGNENTAVITTSNGGSTVSSNNGGSSSTSDNSSTVQSVETGDSSMLPETAAATSAALAALGIILAARKRRNG
ncbi:MAG: SpaA isopeptide-forming pilin-related protein [Anaerovoracaceae bacterium]|jgi:hypothetical protein